MSAEGDRQSVFRTTKVRTALKGDSSWIQRRSQSTSEVEDDDKPWIAEVRANRLNSDFNLSVEDHLVTSPGRNGQSSPSTDRGVYTKTDTKQASPSTNGYMGTSGFTRRASDEYKKIATHTVRSSVEQSVDSPEPSLSAEEQERRTEAASKVLDNSARKQRSYVLSAAKKFETTPGKEDISASPPTAFVARRVVISDDEDTGSTLISPPKQSSKEMSVDEPMPPKSSAPKSESTTYARQETITKSSNTNNERSKTAVSTSESTIHNKNLDYDVTSSVTETKKVSTSKISTTTSSWNETVIEATSVAPVATLKTSQTTTTKSDPIPTQSPKPKPIQKNSTLHDQDLLDLSGGPPVNPGPTPTDLMAGGCLPKTEKTKGSLDMLAVDIIPIDTNTDKLSTQNTKTKIEITQTVVQTKTDVQSKSKPVEKTSTLNDKDLLDLTGSSTQKTVKPTPTTTTDLLTGGSLPKTQKTTQSLDLLASDVIPIDTNMDILSTNKTQSKVTTQTTVIQTKTLEKSSDVQNQTTVYEQKSSTSSSSWDKWTAPNIETIIEECSSTVQEEKELEPDAKKNLVYIKQYLNCDSSGYSTSNNSTDFDYVTSSSSSYSYSSLPSTANKTACTYCGELVGNDSKITIEHLNISCHPECFKCGICSKQMGDFIHSMFLHRGTVHCENCYANVI